MSEPRGRARRIGPQLLCSGLLGSIQDVLAQEPEQQDLQQNFDIDRLPIVAALAELYRHVVPPIRFTYLPATVAEEQTLIGPLKGHYTVG